MCAPRAADEMSANILPRISGYRSSFRGYSAAQSPAGRKLKKNESVNVASASIYFFGCCCYNCCFCCFKGWCGRDFCLRSWICCQITWRRDRWLWGLHLICFCIHFGWAIAAYTAGQDNDMRVVIYRVKPSWQNRGGGYGYEVVPASNQFIYIHVLTALFFGFSAFMHAIWVFVGPWHERFLWKKLDDCLCLWYASRVWHSNPGLARAHALSYNCAYLAGGGSSTASQRLSCSSASPS